MEPPPVQYVATPDGYNLAYATAGSGTPLVFLPLGLNHVQLAWRQDGRISEWLKLLASRFRLVQYDSRGQGMSQRGLTAEHSMADYLIDLETVIDRLGLERVVLLGYFYTGHTAVSYAIKHPERVQALVLISCSVSIRAWPLDSLLRLAEQNWEAMLYNWVPPTATPEERADYLAFFKQTRTQPDWLLAARAFSVSNIADVLPRLQTPSLVMHPREFLWLPPEESANLAARITNARFSLIDGVLPLGNAAQGVPAIESFLRDVAADEIVPHVDAAMHATSRSTLSQREIEVVQLLARGRSNQQIADELVISLNTVARHVSNILTKTGAGNRAEAVAYAMRHGLVRE